MVLSEYYDILGLPVTATIDEIKRAYRKKARLYHPDINHLPDAKDQFIRVTEAYDFLIANYGKGDLTDQDYFRIVEEWRKYRQDRSKARAQYFARSSYARFRNSKYYKSTRILNASSVIFNFLVSLLVLTYTIFGFILKLKNPVPGTERSTLVSFILLMSISLILFTVSFIYLKAYIETNRKRKKVK
ncbi:MAG: J domain-containing protein [Bacteroidota bacterium]|nr:J domain-containing protein [Bacteroidota bacterium]